MNSGIYKIRNIQNNHIYVGSALDTKKRWNKHRHLLRIGKHHNPHLQNAWVKYGEDNFEFSVLEYCDKQELISKEQEYIDLLRPDYNMIPAGGSRLGMKHSEETKRKLSIAKIGKTSVSWNKGKKGIYSTETLQKMSNARIGIVFSIDHKLNLSKSHKGKTPSLETRKKRSDTMKAFWASKREQESL